VTVEAGSFTAVFEDAGDGDWLGARGTRRDRVKKRDLERHLVEHRCTLARQASSHEVWENTAPGQRSTIPRNHEIKPQSARVICRRLGAQPPTRAR
jgi:hypothetical protein